MFVVGYINLVRMYSTLNRLLKQKDIFSLYDFFVTYLITIVIREVFVFTMLFLCILIIKSRCVRTS